MKKIVLSLAVLFSVALASCGGAKTEAADTDTVAADTTEVVADTTPAVDSNAVDSNKAAE